MKLTYLSHSCFTIETAVHRLIIDPFLTGNPLATTKPEEVEADFVLLSHGHEDHLGDAVAIAKRTGATVIANYETAMYCGDQGAKVHPMQLGGAYQFPFGRVKFTIAHHSSSVKTEHGFLYLGNPAGMLITSGDQTIYHAGDTALFLDMKLIGELDPIDVALLPIGDNFTMGPEDAARAADFLNAKLAIGMHFNTFELIKIDPERFVEKAKSFGRAAKILRVGESLEV